MSLFKRKDSEVWWIDFTNPNGQRVRQSSGTGNKKAAQELHDKLKAESWRVSKLKEKSRTTWQIAVVHYLNDNEKQRSLSRTKSILKYLHSFLSGKYLDEINSEIIGQIKMQRKSDGVSESTINRHLTVLRAVLNYAHRQEWITSVPAIVMFKTEQRQLRYLTHEEVAKLLKELPQHLVDMVVFSLATGLRQANVCGLKWEQVDLFKKTVTIHAHQAKGKKMFCIPLNIDAMTVLKRCHGKHDTFVFTYKGASIAKGNNKAWRKALKRAGITDFRWHDLRRTWASWHIQNGTPLAELKELGAWQSLEMVLVYAQLDNSRLVQYAGNVSIHDTNSSQCAIKLASVK